jgi:hypothetical protein
LLVNMGPGGISVDEKKKVGPSGSLGTRGIADGFVGLLDLVTGVRVYGR